MVDACAVSSLAPETVGHGEASADLLNVEAEGWLSGLSTCIVVYLHVYVGLFILISADCVCDGGSGGSVCCCDSPTVSWGESTASADSVCDGGSGGSVCCRDSPTVSWGESRLLLTLSAMGFFFFFFFFFFNIFLFFYTFKWIHTIHTIHVTGHNCTKVYITISIARFERTPTVRSPKRRDQRVHVEF